MKPFLKWVGGKQDLVEQLGIPDEIQGDYVEPFVGGGSVLLHVLATKKVKGKVRASDTNKILIETYQKVKDDPEGLCTDVQKLVSQWEQSEDRKAFYYKVRSEFNKRQTSERFIFLNKMGFRGIFRLNKSGGFNVPYGNYAKFPLNDTLNSIRDVSVAFKHHRVEFSVASAFDVLETVGASDVVYCDPPYDDTFVGYSADGFSKEQTERLITMLKETKAHAILSNSATDFVKGLAKDMAVREITARRAIHSRDPSATASECIITNRTYPE